MSPHRPLSTVGLLIALTLLLVVAQPIHSRILALFALATPIIHSHSLLGPLVFVALCALSATLAFFSSGFFIPIAVQAWGPVPAFALLWLGWMIGGAGAYAVGRYVGDPLVRRLVKRETVDRYEGWIHDRVTIGRVILLHMAVPSEAAAYLLGMARAPWGTFLAAIAVAQFPFAVVSVLLGQSFLDRRIFALVGFAAASVALSALALRTLTRAGPVAAAEVLPSVEDR